jgi:hypothetical protein
MCKTKINIKSAIKLESRITQSSLIPALDLLFSNQKIGGDKKDTEEHMHL